MDPIAVDHSLKIGVAANGIIVEDYDVTIDRKRVFVFDKAANFLEWINIVLREVKEAQVRAQRP